ncbi:MAG: hypothetical protein F7C38_02115 [Desulfurococcales archaeon]|nr:hypothetical protein [Desulfurococcales archaeon]
MLSGALYLLSLAIAAYLAGTALSSSRIPYVGVIPLEARYLSYAIALWAFIRPRDRWLIGVLILAALALSPYDPLHLVSALLLVYFSGSLYAFLGETRVVSLSRLFIGLLALVVLYGSFVLTGYGAGRLLREAMSWTPPFKWDAYAIATLLKSTLLYRVMIVTILAALLYRIARSATDLIVAMKARGEAAKALLNIEYAGMEKQLARFEGPQYPALEWGLSLLMTMLAAPLVYSLVTAFIQGIVDRLGVHAGTWMPVAAAIASTIISWIPLKLIASTLTRTVPSSQLLSEKPGRKLASIIILSLIIIIPLFLVLQAPKDLIVEAITGKPSSLQDPLAGKINEPSTSYYRNLAKLVDLIVKLFWGG